MRSILRNSIQIILLGLISTCAFGQAGSVKGSVQESEMAEPVVGANIILKGSSVGTTSDVEGNFILEGIPLGSQVLVISFIGYAPKEISINVLADRTVNLGLIKISSEAIGLDEVSIIASMAIDRKTPIAVSTITGAVIESKVGNQEFPEILRNTPSVYVTKQGGGFGDSRINVRGFDQRNTAVMINGIPVNDMENGWVYWSNWAGLSDVTSSMQVQRGLSASKLAVSSVGGTINIITNAAQMQKGGNVSSSIGNDGFFKFGAVYSTGLSEKGWALSLQGTHTRGNGYADGTEFRAYSYFASIAKVINDKHSVHLTALGAPQWHNQRNFGAFDGVTYDTLQKRGIRYNPQWGLKSGEEFSWNTNFYHKPKVFLNHYWNVSPKTELATSAYVSFGRGGGTGDLGRINGRFRTDRRFKATKPGGDGTVRWDDIVSWNAGNSVPDFGANNLPWTRGGGFDGQYVGTNENPGSGFILRSSINSHNWYGLLSTLTHTINDQFTFTGGVDARFYKGIHYRRVENLLGLSAFFDDDDINNPVKYVTGEGKDGGKIDYYNDGLVKWGGLFGQMEYSNNNLSAFLSGSFSNQSFKRVDYFLYQEGQQESDWESFTGGTLKAGANYNLTENHNVFVNGGYFSQQPIFDNVFLNNTNNVNTNSKNQQVYAFEVGYGYRSAIFSLNVNAYNTEWTDRQISRTTQVNGQDGTANFFGVGQLHKGIELDFSLTPISKLNITGMASFGNWKYSDDFTASVFDTNQQLIGTLDLFMKDVKIPDAAQTTLGVGADYEVIKRFRIYGNYYYADKIYADFNVATDASFLTPGSQAWQVPSYDLVDAGASYGFNLSDVEVILRVNVNNVFDNQYLSESETNILFNPNTEMAKIGDNGSTRNVVYYGLGRTWNVGLKIKF
ncbi:MAG: TonB-dependent receptor [Cyclobacteriaceae bacterium]